MDAGRGASEQADRAAARVEKARRDLAVAEQQQRAWAAGADGERRTADKLATLGAHGWVVLHDLHWPGRPFANIDHIAIGPGGVVVIDSKNWSGRVEVKDGVLRQNGYRRTESVAGASGATAAVAVWLEPQHRRLAIAVIVLVGQPTPVSQPNGVRIVGLDELVPSLLALPPALGPTEVATVARYLSGLLDGDRSPTMVTTQALIAAPPSGHREPSATARSRGSRPRPPAAQPRRARGRTRPTRTNHLVLGLLKVLGVLFLAFVVLPQVIQSMTTSMVLPVPAPTRSPVTVTTPAR
jgi:hypothetical protein